MDINDPFEYFYTEDGQQASKVQCALVEGKRIDFQYVSIWKLFLIKSRQEHEMAQANLSNFSIVKSSSNIGASKKQQIYAIKTGCEVGVWTYLMNYSSSIILACSALEAYSNEKLLLYKPNAEDLATEYKAFKGKTGDLDYQGVVERTLRIEDKVFNHMPKHLNFSEIQTSKLNNHKKDTRSLIAIRNELIHFKYGDNRTHYDFQERIMIPSKIMNHIFPKGLTTHQKRPPFSAYNIVSSLVNEIESNK